MRECDVRECDARCTYIARCFKRLDREESSCSQNTVVRNLRENKISVTGAEWNP